MDCCCSKTFLDELYAEMLQQRSAAVADSLLKTVNHEENRQCGIPPILSETMEAYACDNG